MRTPVTSRNRNRLIQKGIRQFDLQNKRFVLRLQGKYVSIEWRHEPVSRTLLRSLFPEGFRMISFPFKKQSRSACLILGCSVAALMSAASVVAEKPAQRPSGSDGGPLGGGGGGPLGGGPLGGGPLGGLPATPAANRPVNDTESAAPTKAASSAGAGLNAGNLRPTQTGGVQSPNYPPGSPDETLFYFCTALIDGDTATASDYISSTATGIAAKMRDGELSEEKILEFSTLLNPTTDLGPQGTQRNTKRTLRSRRSQSIVSFVLKNEKETYKITEVTYSKPKGQ